ATQSGRISEKDKNDASHKAYVLYAFRERGTLLLAVTPPQAMPAWWVKTRRAPSRHCRDSRVFGHTTTAVHDNEYTPPPLQVENSASAPIRPIPNGTTPVTIP
ncbi:unnamed protein product, partial [Laminaria digitata]